MDDANATVTTLAELLQSPRPVTVTATAHSVFSSTPPPHRSTTCCVLTPLPRSTVLVGTLTLPALSPPCSCLRFSDASATLCCDLLRFRPAALNREIRVTAWNFIPFKRHGCDVAHGLLEIINWRFSGTNQGSNAVDSLPLAPNCVRQSGARMRSLHGVVESVGPLFVVQCTMAASTSGLNSGSKVNLPGFSVQLVCCECRFCCSKEVLIGKLNESRKGHSFTKMEIVYFCGSASSWHPVITKLIDERVVVSGLKKKLVYLTKEESREMYVTKDESVLHVGSCSEKCMPSLKSEIKGKGECGSYIGVVKGAYMQGMVLELDHDVWLLLTDQLHTSMHGLRVGSIQGAPVWLCTHDLNGCGRVLNCSFLKLVIPISIFICHCIHTLLRIMKSENHCKLLPIGNQFSILSREARYNGRSLRRIIQSEDVGVVLLGYLKVDPSTRRLHLVDATGGVDIVIPDLPLTWNPNEIYEVTDYEVFMDKIDEPVDQIERLGRCIKSSTFVEAMLFPFILLFDGKSGIARPCNASWDKTKELSKSCLSGNNEYKFSNKRQKLVKESLLQIGDYYIIDNKRRDISGSTKDVDFGRSDSVKLLIDSGKRIWSLSFIYDENLSDHLSEYTSAKDSLSPSADGVSSNHQKLLRRSNSEPSSVSSDVCLYLPISLADVFEDNVMELEDSQSLQSVISEDSANLSLGTGTSEDRPKSCFGTQRSNSLFPEGNLMSLEGNVIEIHKTGSGFFSSCSSGANVDSLQLTGLVNICGSVNKHTFPTGFGPGVTAVFHRILYARAQNKFMLLPVSFIVIKSIKVCDKQCGDRPSVLSSTKDADDASREYISCLISELPQGLTHKKIVFRCRNIVFYAVICEQVVAVLVLVIERKTTNFIAETKVNAQGTLLDIPLACFLLEDGSSSCCCWASAERAATLLRLREELTTSHHLGRILKKHKKITVKSHALSVDSPCQDHIFTVASGNALCSSDENILKFILCNACIGGIWNVVAGGMDAEETRQLGEEYLTEMLNVHNMRNMWAEEVSYPRTRAEARHMIQELLKN
ncbi:CST complex subunit [Vigna angularis]|uniref:CST complex subunit CTC1 n=1 Tax=Phaseolus angularis TaxID=3914 RepID=A0A8T0KEM0_PHAAN|nr:CST complex subunit [Vigna angularis]